MFLNSCRRARLGGLGLATAVVAAMLLVPGSANAAEAHKAPENVEAAVDGPDLLVAENGAGYITLVPGDGSRERVEALGIPEIGAVAPGPNGELYYVTRFGDGGGRLFRLLADGSTRTLDTDPDGYRGLTVTPNGDIYASSWGGMIYRYPGGGRVRENFAYVGLPTFLDQDLEGNILTAGNSNGPRNGTEALKITPQGTVTVIATDFINSVSVAQRPDGSYIVIEEIPGRARVTVISPNGSRATLATIDGAYDSAIAANGDVYVSSYASGSIFKIPALGGEPTAIASNLDRPYGLSLAEPFAKPTPQTITFTTTAPTNATVGGNYTPAALGGGSGREVTFSSTTPAVCSYNAETGKVSFLAVGTCTIAADQAGGANGNVLYAPAEQATQTVVVKHPQPTISAAIESSGPVNAAGWYRTPATVTYTCAGGVGQLDCPVPVTRADTAKGFVLVRTVTDSAGGSATARTTLQVDTRAPSLTTRQTGKAPYTSTAKPIRCTATDAGSGLKRACTISYAKIVRKPRSAPRRNWTATATDVAGNTTTRRGTITIR